MLADEHSAPYLGPVPGRTLWLLHLTGCAACTEAKPIVEAFAKDHPEVSVEYLDLADVAEDAWQGLEPPDDVPSYAVMVEGARPRTVVGRVLKREELELWVFR